MHRREFIGTLAGGAVTVALPTRLLRAEKVHRLGVLGGVPGGPLNAAFAKRLTELGYLDGKNIKIEWRLDNGHPELFPEMAADLVRLNVDIIAAGSNFAGQAAQKATSIIPIVVLASHDGVGSGFYKSLARPGGNITGSESMAPELDAKRVEILKDIFPQLSHLTVLHNPTFAGAKLHSDAILSSAAKQNTKVQFVEILTVADFDAAFSVLLHDRPDAVLTVADNLIFQRRQRIVSFGNEHRIPMIHESKIFVKEGALISYGADVEEVFRRGADFVDKILRGEKAGDIPVEQPTKFDFAINLKTAKELGVTFPSNVILSANVVID